MSRKRKKHKRILTAIPIAEYNNLVEVCAVQSHSNNEHRMVAFLISKITQLNLDYEIDKVGNILVIKGKAKTYPCIVSHMDTVHKIVDDYKLYYSENNNIPNSKVLFAKSGKTRTGIGGDDKCGIYACLYFLMKLPIVKIVFFTQEESGCKGSNDIDKSFFDNCRYIIQLDRRDDRDFIDKHYKGKTVSDAFSSEIGHLKQIRGFKSTTGVITDSINLWAKGIGISCVNISSGYYSPHTDSEYIVVDKLWNSVQFVQEMVTQLKSHRYESIPKPIVIVSKAATDYKVKWEQCFICKKWKEKSQGFKWHARNNEFVCYTCFSKEMNTAAGYVSRDSTEPDVDTKSILKNDADIYLRCPICSTYKHKKLGSYTSKDGLYDGVWVCSDCNLEKKWNNLVADSTEYTEDNPKDDPAQASEQINEIMYCEKCKIGFDNPAIEGHYLSVSPLVWVCNTCFDKGDDDLLVCDICGAKALKSECKESIHDCGCICSWCMRLYYGEEEDKETADPAG